MSLSRCLSHEGGMAGVSGDGGSITDNGNGVLIETGRSEVERVLTAWLDGSTTENHRTKWFAQGEALARVDEAIRRDFGDLVLQAEAGSLTASWSKQPRSLVALILLLDQFSRHFFRGKSDRDERVAACDRQALPLAESLLAKGWQRRLSAEEHVFALMPLRHTPSEDRLLRVMEEASAREKRLQQSQELLQRFKKATKRRLQGIQDTAEEGAEILEHMEFEPKDPAQMDRHELVKVVRGFLDARCPAAATTPSQTPALETAGPRGESSSSTSTSTSTAADGDGDGDGSRGNRVSSDSACGDGAANSTGYDKEEDGRTEIDSGDDGNLKRGSDSVDNGPDSNDSSKHSNSGDGSGGGGGGPGGGKSLRTVAVSLSGGVDSMALCLALVHLKPVYGFSVMGIHIDYGNRHESGREAEFVEGWCKRHGVVFYKRAIGEVRRGVTARDEYEKVAREIRFDAYKAALEGKEPLDGWRSRDGGGGGAMLPAVMFGHHEGDVEENVLTNIIKGCSILELAGMLPENTVNGVRVWRPMLPFGKEVVYDFAHKFGVPYFKDTTPSWSTRGKLRRQLIPMMEDVFGSGVLGHLSAVARESDDLRELVHRELFQPVWDKAVVQRLGLSLDVEPYRGYGLLFWKEVLRRLVHKMGMPMVRDKTLGMFVRDTLQRHTDVPLKEKWVELRKEYVGYVCQGILYVFRMGVFLPPNTSYGEQAEGTPVPLDGGVVQVGPWRITTVEAEAKPPQELKGLERGRPRAANTPPFTSMEELMDGEFSYVVAVPNTPEAALTVQPGAKAKAPAWRDVDPRIRRGIPLVAPPRSRDPVPLAECGARMVTVTLKYMGMSTAEAQAAVGSNSR